MTGRYCRGVAADAELGRRVLRSSVLRTSALLGVAVFGLVIGIATVGAGERNGWWVVLVCALLTLFLGLLLVRPNRLELDDSGFSTVDPFGRRSRVEWRDCGPFRAKRPDLDLSYRAPMQVFYDTKESDRHPLALVAQVVAGGSAALPDTYGMSAAALADLMNRYRAATGHDVPADLHRTHASGMGGISELRGSPIPGSPGRPEPWPLPQSGTAPGAPS